MSITLIIPASLADHLAQVNDLMLETLGLSFAGWQARWLWTDDYTGYGIFEQGRLSAYAAAYRLNLLITGQLCEALQIGVMTTRNDYRGGVSAARLWIIFWTGGYHPYLPGRQRLCAQFYPRFGFHRVKVWQALVHLPANGAVPPTPGQMACRSSGILTTLLSRR